MSDEVFRNDEEFEEEDDFEEYEDDDLEYGVPFWEVEKYVIAGRIYMAQRDIQTLSARLENIKEQILALVIESDYTRVHRLSEQAELIERKIRDKKILIEELQLQSEYDEESE